MNLRNNIAQLFMFLLLLTCFGWCKAHAQDSTLMRFDNKMIIDSIIFVGDTVEYNITQFSHIPKSLLFQRMRLYSGTHDWVFKNNERICLICSFWQRFYITRIPIYSYDEFFLARKKAEELMKRSK